MISRHDFILNCGNRRSGKIILIIRIQIDGRGDINCSALDNQAVKFQIVIFNNRLQRDVSVTAKLCLQKTDNRCFKCFIT